MPRPGGRRARGSPRTLLSSSAAHGPASPTTTSCSCSTPSPPRTTAPRCSPTPSAIVTEGGELIGTHEWGVREMAYEIRHQDSSGLPPVPVPRARRRRWTSSTARCRSPTASCASASSASPRARPTPPDPAPRARSKRTSRPRCRRPGRAPARHRRGPLDPRASPRGPHLRAPPHVTAASPDSADALRDDSAHVCAHFRAPVPSDLRARLARRFVQCPKGGARHGRHEHQPGRHHRQPDPRSRSCARPGSGMAVCELRIACNTRRKDGQTGEWVDKPNYFDVTICGRRARTRPSTCEGPRRRDRRPPRVARVAGPGRATSASPSTSSPTTSSSWAAARGRQRRRRRVHAAQRRAGPTTTSPGRRRRRLRRRPTTTSRSSHPPLSGRRRRDRGGVPSPRHAPRRLDVRHIHRTDRERRICYNVAFGRATPALGCARDAKTST